MEIDKDVINRLKVSYYENWKPEDYGYMELCIHTMTIHFTNDIDCDGNAYFNHKSFLTTIKKWEEALEA